MPKKANTIQAQIQLLQNGTDEKLMIGLSNLRKQGTPELMPFLLKRWNESSNDELTQKIFDFITDIKPQEAIGDIMIALNNIEYVDKKSLLVSMLWQSSLDASEYIDDLIAIALKGDFMTVLEVSTVIESFDTVFNEQDMMESIYQIDKRLEIETNEELRNILNSLKGVISKLPVE